MAQSAVVVSLDPAVVGAVDVAATLVETLRRGPGHVHLDPSGVEPSAVAAIVALASAVAPSTPVSTEPAPDGAVAVRVGVQAPPETIAVVADRHGTRLAVDGRALRQRHAPSALGVMTAAAFAAGEVFKRVVRPRSDRAIYRNGLAFCPVTLGDEPSRAPQLPGGWSPTLGLVGNGAVGTAHARVLSGLDATDPSAITVDPQVYGPRTTGLTASAAGRTSSRRRPRSSSSSARWAGGVSTTFRARPRTRSPGSRPRGWTGPAWC